MDTYFKKNLKYLRKINNVSQQELSEKINIDRSTISKWETLDTEVPLNGAIDISNFFNINIVDFLETDLSKESSFNRLDNVLFSKTKELNDSEKEMIINIIDTIKKNDTSDD